MLLMFAALALLSIGLIVFLAAWMERVAGDRMVVEMRTWAEDVIPAHEVGPGQAA